MKFRNHKNGFTLVELIVVLVILAILAAILVPALTGYIDKAHQKVCLVHKGEALRDITACEVYETGGQKKMNTAELQKLSESSEFFCRQGGHYKVQRAADGSIAIICPEHDTQYYFNMQEAFSNVLENNAELKALLLNRDSLYVDSGATRGNFYSKVEAALNLAGFNTSSENVNTWAFHKTKAGSNYTLYWSTEDISDKSTGDCVKVIRYDSAKKEYTTGYMKVTQNTNTNTASGGPQTYNCFVQSPSGFTASGDPTDSYDDIREEFLDMPPQP